MCFEVNIFVRNLINGGPSKKAVGAVGRLFGTG